MDWKKNSGNNKVVQLDWRSMTAAHQINFPSDRRSVFRSEKTSKKSSARRIHWGRVYFCIAIFWSGIFENVQKITSQKIDTPTAKASRRAVLTGIFGAPWILVVRWEINFISQNFVKYSLRTSEFEAILIDRLLRSFLHFLARHLAFLSVIN